MNESANGEQSYTAELVRKAIHLCSLSIPIIYYFIEKSTALKILLPLTLAFAFADVARFIHPAAWQIYQTYFGWLLRPHERDNRTVRLNGATYVLLSASICILIFPKVIVVTAFSILIISDSTAALFGKKFGKHKFMKKSLEGTTAFFASAAIVVIFSPKVDYLPMEYFIGIAAALVGSVIEAAPIALDDNLSIPLSVGATMWLMYVILLPTVNVFALDAVS